MSENSHAVDFLQPLVAIQGGKAITTSQQGAIVFEKEHAHILRSIQTLSKDVPKDFNQSNFGLVDYLDTKGEKRPLYNLTRDGFTLLAMGFTGKKALQFKLAYIEAFNKMEQKLQGERAAFPAQPSTPPPPPYNYKTPFALEKKEVDLDLNMRIANEVYRQLCNCRVCYNCKNKKCGRYSCKDYQQE